MHARIHGMDGSQTDQTGTVRHLSTYTKMFDLILSLGKTMLTSWHFGAGQYILGKKNNMSFMKYR